MMSDAKIMTLNDLNGSEQFTKDYAPRRDVGRSGNPGEGASGNMVVIMYPHPLVYIELTDLQKFVGSRLGK